MKSLATSDTNNYPHNHKDLVLANACLAVNSLQCVRTLLLFIGLMKFRFRCDAGGKTEPKLNYFLMERLHRSHILKE